MRIFLVALVGLQMSLLGCEPSETSSDLRSPDGFVSEEEQFVGTPVANAEAPTLGCDDASYAYADELLSSIKRSAPKYCVEDSECEVAYAGTDCSPIQEFIPYSVDADVPAIEGMNTAIENFNRVSDAIFEGCGNGVGSSCALVSRPALVECRSNRCVVSE